jgi:ABC-type transport system involved in multi-copper enzyme maturation permease subunit
LGQGRSLFSSLIWLEHLAVLLLVPSMTASALTVEKERETLPLLLLTRISPAEIILQKFLSRVVPALSYVLLSFPLMAVAYSYGGITYFDLISEAALLLFAVIDLAAFSLLCSSYCRTTVEAIILSYVGQVLLSLVTCGFVPMFGGIGWGSSQTNLQNGGLMLLGFRTFLSSGLFLVIATESLHRRAFVPPRNILLDIFRWLDGVFTEWNTVTGGVVLVRDGSPLPLDQPVAWRETAKRSLGTFRYLVRVLVVIELPVLLVSQVVNIEMVRGHAAMTYLWYIVCFTSAAMICIHAANVIAAERSRQTLDVLLATPLTGRELLLQKLAGLRRLLTILAIPCATIIGFTHWFRDYKRDFSYVAQSVCVAVIFGWGLTWLAFWIGLRAKSTISAVFTSFGVVAAGCGLPIFISFAARSLLQGSTASYVSALMALSPVTLMRMAEEIPAEEFRAGQGWSPRAYPWGFSIAIVGYGIASFLLRRHCLKNANSLLGRSDAADEKRRGPSSDAAEIEGAFLDGTSRTDVIVAVST